MVTIQDIITVLHHSYNGSGYGGGWYGFIQPACDPETVTTALDVVTSLS